MLATEALQTLAQEDLTPGPSLDASTDTESITHIHRLCMQSWALDQEVILKTVLDVLAERGHGHLLPPKLEDCASDGGSEVDDIDTPPMWPSRRIIIEMVQRMQLEPQGATAQELLNPAGATTTTPHHSTAASPVKQSPTPSSLAQRMSG